MSSSLRSATLTERTRPLTGVVIGPVTATPAPRIASSTAGGNGFPPYRSITSEPASCTSQSNSTPVASMTRRVASVSSGPGPSPGMRTTRCATGPESTYAPVRVAAVSELADAAAQADAFAQDGLERELAELRAQWADDVEAAARSG